MKIKTTIGSLLLIICVLPALQGFCQNTADTAGQYKTVSAGSEYKRSGLHEALWGKNYRKEWAQPVKVQVLDLSTFMGGLKPLKAGGGHQSKSLHLQTKDGRMYTMRTVNKTLTKVLPISFILCIFCN